MLGDWDAADRELIQADSDGLAVIEHIACYRGWRAALRGDVGTAETMLADLRDLRGNEDAQTKAEISLAEAFIAAARHQPDEALRHAQDVVALRDTLGISHECVRWAWPLAARTAHELGDVVTTGDLLALLDSYQPGYLAPALQAERDLTGARLAGRDDGQDADVAFAAGSPACASRAPPITSVTGCSTTRSTSLTGVMPTPLRWPPTKPVASGPACIASRCSPGPPPSSTQNPGYRPNRLVRCGVSSTDGLDGAGAARLTERRGQGSGEVRAVRRFSGRRRAADCGQQRGAPGTRPWPLT